MFNLSVQRPQLFTPFRSRTILSLGVVLLLFVAACTPSADPIISDEATPSPEEIGGPDFSALVITTDMAVGKNKITFGVMDREGMPVLESASGNATVRTYLLVPHQDAREPKATVPARFRPWPTNVRGVFEADLEFDIEGTWELEVDLLNAAGEPVTAKASFVVKEESSTPAIGAPVPPIVTLTVADVEDLSHLSSSAAPDPDLYQLSVHEAVNDDKPFVVVFATPAFCVSATCGPQVAELAKVKDQYSDRADFIHVEIFKDPHLIKDGRPTEGILPAVQEWGLPTEPWTFIIDADGLVSAKFEQFTPSQVIEAALLEAF